MEEDILQENNHTTDEHLMPLRPRKKLSAFGHGKEREQILESLSMLIASGMDIGSIIASLMREAHTKYSKEVLAGIAEGIDAGDPLWKALEGSGLFAEHTISFIKLGEESGRLPETMGLIVEQIEKQRAFSSQIKSALLYPVMVLSVSGVVGLGITWFIIPRLAVTFSQLNLKLPFLTRVIVWIGNFLLAYGLIAVPILLMSIILILYLVFGYKRTKFIGQSILFHTPIFSRLVQEVELARLGYTMGSLLNAGMPIVEAVNSLKRSTDFKRYVKLYEYLEKATTEGQSFENSLRSYPKSSKLIPFAIQDMIINAEQSGKLADTFIKVGKNYESRIETTSKNLTVLLEPILLLIVWFVVLLIALAIIMPIYSIFDGVQKGNQAPIPVPAPVSTNTEVKQTENSAEPVVENNSDVGVAETVKEDTKTETNVNESVKPSVPSVKVGSTPTGYLNVRKLPSTSSAILTKIYPTEVYPYTEYKDGWYEIELKDGTVGWVSEQYVKIVQPVSE